MARRRRIRKTSLILLTVLLATPIFAQPGQAGDDEDRLAEKVVARRIGASPSDLKTISAVRARYPISSETVDTFKVQDRRTGEIHLVALDDDREVNIDRLEAEEELAYTARFGRLDRDLARTIARLPESATVGVAIWLEQPPFERPERPAPDSLSTEEEINAFLQRAGDQRASFVSGLTAPIMVRIREMGYEAQAETYSPLVTSVLRVGDIRRVAEWAEVDRIYGERTMQSHLSIARVVTRANLVQNSGFTGAGIETAQVEIGGRLSASHPDLPAITKDPLYTCGTASNHSMMVAGIFLSKNATHKGISPGVKHWAGGACNNQAPDQLAWKLRNGGTRAAQFGAHVINLSYGGPATVASAEEMFWDDLMLSKYVTITASSGNGAEKECFTPPKDPPIPQVASPGLAYNNVTVGAFTDRGTPDSPPTFPDLMWLCSNWVNPNSTYGDREKPDVVAPGFQITSTKTGGLLMTDNGTSFAAPTVAATAALMMERDSDLTYYPEAVRAILAATSYQNLLDNRTSRQIPTKDFKDGTGGIDAQRATRTAAKVPGTGWDIQAVDCNSQFPIKADISVPTKNRMRVAVAWNNDPAYPSYSSRPSADFDLIVRNPNGTPAAQTATHDNTLEIVDFVPEFTGTYKIEIVRVKCQFSPDAVAWAWHNEA